ncbi:unnamed protein product [Tilletia controversa]|uniref:Maltose/galactoside acetyltransferase domain-containing protein n=2 Tax=Tilletia TaxID=13289 RepID=A0A177VDB4_9BASI|nr:hypothetical protein CF336_g5420 [Tilletia laevis]KAE8193942.1 hypothetical protein CF328_g4896 [Tilletia controversa]KAE8265356.1 hypothetical protein A4X03_0g313 [Tilletia caries]KAE8195966.1 hypothetical protein CF335_g4967 [Tilletia laevis]CAD6887332.1 unnamed protein product [Tilletia caries]
MASAQFAKIDAEYADRLTTLTETNKSLTGLAYHCMDPALVRSRLRARRIVNKFNTSPANPEDPPEDATLQDLLTFDFSGKARAAHLRDLFGIDESWTMPTIEPPLQVDYGVNVKWDKGSWWYANFGLVLLDCAEIKIGSGVLFGPNCQLYAATHSVSLVERDTMLERALPISIEDDCWLGGAVLVMAGVTIGQGCTIGAGAVVTKSIPPYSIAVGNPARVVRTLTDAEIGEKRVAARNKAPFGDVAATLASQTRTS